MGGSNGGGFLPKKSLNELLTEEMEQEQNREFRREVNSYLSDLLIGLNDRDTEQIASHMETLKKTLEKEIGGVVELRFGGSVSKHTFANGLSDIDMLVELNNSSLAGVPPRDALQYFAQRIGERLPRSDISVGELAVTVRFSDDHEIQLLPCVRQDTGIRIAVPGRNEWSKVIKPMSFAEKLTQVNQDCSGRVVPTIKLFKVLNANMPENCQMSGYHIESLAINAFRSRPSSLTYHDMLKDLCNYAKGAVLEPIRDNTGQSVHVDDYLEERNSAARKRVSRSLARLSSRLQRADSQLSLELWRTMFE